MFVNIEDAEKLLRASQPVAIPTETVWGLAAKADDPVGVKRIFELKGRPSENPLIMHIASFDSMHPYVTSVPEHTHELASHFWPGGLTLVVPVKEDTILEEVRAGLNTCAFRVPDHPTTLKLINRTGPLVAPSANMSGKPSATQPSHIETDFGTSLPILATSIPCRHGIESTILVFQDSEWKVGRLGAITLDKITNVIGYEPSCVHETKRPLCPGQFFRHYAPVAKLSLLTKWDIKNSASYDAVLGFSDREYPNAPLVVYLGNTKEPAEITLRLYAALRELDEYMLQNVFVDIDLPSSAAYIPVLDRLKKAAK